MSITVASPQTEVELHKSSLLGLLEDVESRLRGNDLDWVPCDELSDRMEKAYHALRECWCELNPKRRAPVQLEGEIYF